MPNAEFLARLGLLVVKDFLDKALCERLRAEIRSSLQVPSLTYYEGSSSLQVGKEFRKAKDAKVNKETRRLVKERLLSAKPIIESHFSLALEGCQQPDFLIYREGDFFRLHRDVGESAECPEHLRKRRISVVIFLNNQSEEPKPDSYYGGSLSFYGLVDIPDWKQYGFPLRGETGLLVGFRSDVYHQVQPIIHGERHTIVSWFY